MGLPEFLAEQGRRYPGFRLLMQAEATDLIYEGGRVAGVRATTPDGPLEIRATLSSAATAAIPLVREKAGSSPTTSARRWTCSGSGLSRKPDRQPADRRRVRLPGRIFVMLNRGDYWQCAYVIPKGSLEEVRRRGIEAFRAERRAHRAGCSPIASARSPTGSRCIC